MLYLIPCVYVFSFLFAGYQLFQHKPQFILRFFIFGLPIYITALSLLNQMGLGGLMPLFQGFKELIVVTALGYLIYHQTSKIQLTLIDKLVLAFFIYTSLYVFLPLGDHGFTQKLLGLKSLSFFPLIYFTGRFIHPKLINLNANFSYILIVSIVAGMVLLLETITNVHLQTYTGYAEFFIRFFDTEPSGNFGLSWTFETSNGLKRFASIYGGPLELGVNTLFTLAALLALYTKDNFKFQLNQLGVIALLVSLLSIVFAISRASFVSYFLMIYVYALVTKKSQLLQVFYYGGIGVVLIIGTINFSDNSSAYHVLQWLDGLEAIAAKPLGMGLGMSGRVSGAVGDNIGGENQLIIIGVQAGIIAVLLYVAIYIALIRFSIQQFKLKKGKIKKLALCLLLIKIGMIIPTFTANAESYVYNAYITWFLAGLLNTLSFYKTETKQIVPQHG
ncbi:MAG TPA: hypothetical protein PLC18_10925 [Sediminibacterium sp.]|uniref:hypothetical protein n=1 Tax=Sediminibacterium sp. TaxID=1917865 RepID=UPI002B82E6B8|nr:hypothetical protein [Sediminibacterium sp.]HQS35917.1 hypothetical protein [Sediminibacterium sp.]